MKFKKTIVCTHCGRPERNHCKCGGCYIGVGLTGSGSMSYGCSECNPMTHDEVIS